MAEIPERRPGSWNRASLVIHSDSLTPDDIGEALGAQPTGSGLKGEPVGPRTPKPRKTSFWAMDANLSDDARIEEQIRTLLDFVDSHEGPLTRLVNSHGAHIRIDASVSDESGQYPMTFDASTLQRLAKVPLALWLTAWMDSPSDKVAESG